MSYMTNMQRQAASILEQDGWNVSCITHNINRQTSVKMKKNGVVLVIAAGGTMKFPNVKEVFPFHNF